MQTYVVRVVEPVGDGGFRGIVRRVADGAEHPFQDEQQLVALLRSGDDGASDPRGGAPT